MFETILLCELCQIPLVQLQNLPHFPGWGGHPRTPSQEKHLFFWSPEKFTDSKHKTLKQSYSSTISHTTAPDTATQTTAVFTWSNTVSGSRTSCGTVATQIDISPQTDYLCDLSMPSVKISPCHSPVYGTERQTSDFRTSPSTRHEPHMQHSQYWPHSRDREKTSELVNLPNTGKSHPETSDSQMDHLCAYKGQHQIKMTPIKAPQFSHISSFLFQPFIINLRQMNVNSFHMRWPSHHLLYEKHVHPTQASDPPVFTA
jgi:hypothetical protein